LRPDEEGYSSDIQPYCGLKVAIILGTRNQSAQRSKKNTSEALAVSEALYVCEHRRTDAIVIAPDADDADLAKAHYTTSQSS